MHTLEICTVPIIDLSQVIVMPKMWVLQACVYVFLLLGNSFVVSKTMYFSVIIPSFKSSFICHGNFPLKDDFSIPDNSPLVATCYNCQVSTSPLLFEFGVEKLYPISEGMIGGWLNIWCISSCIAFKTHFLKKT